MSFFIFTLLDEVEKEIKEDAGKNVWIEHCINIKELCDYTVSCSYGDMVLIICVVKDYLRTISEKEGPTWDYYRTRFTKMADRLSAQIEYDYDEAMRRCKKKMAAKESNNDVGEDAMMLAVKYGGQTKKKRSKQNAESDSTGGEEEQVEDGSPPEE